jgi:hypothetical protein
LTSSIEGPSSLSIEIQRDVQRVISVNQNPRRRQLEFPSAKGLGSHIAARLPDPAFLAGAELGHWFSHFHARASVLRGLLEYARTFRGSTCVEVSRRDHLHGDRAPMKSIERFVPERVVRDW